MQTMASAQFESLISRLIESNRRNGARSNESRRIRLRLRALGHRGGAQGRR